MGYLLLDDLRANALSLMSVTLLAAVPVRPGLTLYINVTDVMIFNFYRPVRTECLATQKETPPNLSKTNFKFLPIYSHYTVM